MSRDRSHLLAIALAVMASLLVAAPAADAAARKVPHGFYGVMWDRAATRSSTADMDAQWALMAQSGVESVRAVFNWAAAQPVAGNAPSFEYTDRLVQAAALHRINLLPVVLGTPDWAALTPSEAGSPPAHVEDYAAYLRALAQRYGPEGTFWSEHPEIPRRPLREWQIWNEPHLNFYWSTKGRSPNAWAPEYAELLKASRPAIKSVDRGATIVLAGLADFAWKHVRRLGRFGIARDFDVAAFNLFTRRPKLIMRGVRVFRRALKRRGVGRKPIWLTETTWPAAKGRVTLPAASWQRAWYTTDEGMALRLRQLYALASRNRRSLRLGRIYWYTWASAYHDGDLFDFAGLTRYDGGAFEPRPALEAYAASARRHQGCAKTPEGVCAR